MAKIILLSGKDCNICEEADKKFKKRFKDEIESGEAQIITLDDDDDALAFWAENKLSVAPTIVVVSDAQKCLVELDPDDILNDEPETPQSSESAIKPVAAAH